MSNRRALVSPLAVVSYTANVDVKRAAGVPSTLNLRNDTNTGQEIDFIIASREIEKDKLKHFLSVPVYRSGLSSSDNSAKLLVFDPNEDRDEIKVDLAEGVYFESNSSGRLRTFEDMTAEKRKQMFQENWAITWDGFEPDEELNTYFLQWNEDSIAWYGGPFQRPVERIKFSRVELRKEAFPTGPLP